MSIFVILIEIAQQAQQLELNCKYNYDFQDYSCDVQNLQTTFTNRTVTNVIGKHFKRSDDKSVKNLFISTQNCPFLLLNLNQFFTNLQFLGVMKSNVQHLMSNDLNGLDELIHLDLSNNPIKQIGHDFFKEKSKILFVSFENCHLKKIDPEFMNNLKNLYSISFIGNDCISFEAYGRSEMILLKRMIIENCQENYQQNFAIGFIKKCEISKNSILDIIVTSIIIFLLILVLSLSTLYINIRKKYILE
ncbi:hypothetical protein PVAND_013199 [Polypedilum vanderplanki]|uniref:Leucine rich repeat protein n=1 Tax=Polypedilum vanderplanki TaxID=319348 RepID=A0A9J6CPY5_POLVA|nr:hypothetical protein PVAND_013199 [Polypedilum vanderplanki]